MAGRKSIPAAAGIGLRPLHHAWVIQQRPDAAWFEVHAENFMLHAPLREDLELIALHYPLAFHAVGLSLGSVSAPAMDHLHQLRALVTRFEPQLVSDHLAWSRVEGIHLPDLLPLPYTEEALGVVISNVHRVQDVLKREILLENPSRYVTRAGSSLSESDFLAEVVLRTGCGVLLDINNLYVSAVNQGTDPSGALDEFLNALPPESVGEIHLAGHAIVAGESGRRMRVDDHGARVCDEVWRLFRSAMSVLGAVPTLIEWDTRIPSFEMLQQEAAMAQGMLTQSRRRGSTLAVAG
jgi:uncharacterized protein (UPF0276 family)